MSDLKTVIEQVNKKVENYKELYSKSEQSVRDHLINPMLKNLGWDTTDPDFVHPNVTNDEGKIPDYTLLKNGKKTFIVEAKKLLLNLDDAKVIKQLARYCYDSGILYGILTDGITWQLFDAFEPNPQNRVVWAIDISKCGADELGKLETLRYDNIEHLTEALKQLKDVKKFDDYFNPIFGSKEAFSNWCKLSLTNNFIDDNKQFKSKEQSVQNYVAQKLNGFLFQENQLQSVVNQPVIESVEVQKEVEKPKSDNVVKPIKVDTHSDKQYRIYDINKPFDLRFITILEGRIDREVSNNWVRLLHIIVRQLILKNVEVEDIAKLTGLNIVHGNRFENGFNVIQNTNYSLQRVEGGKAGKAIFVMANKFNIPVNIEFVWKDNDEAVFPNEYGKIVNN